MFRGFRRFFASDSKVPVQLVPTPPSRARKWSRRLLAATGVAASMYLLDIWVNDDWEIITDRFRRHLSPEERKDRPRVLILGSGWGAMSMLRKLHTDEFNVTVVSPRNYFLFTPLLPSTTVGTLEVRSIMEPVRHYVKRSRAQEARFIESECIKVDIPNKKVICKDKSLIKGAVDEFELPYDHLVVAVGADTATFGIPGVKENSVFLRSIEDTTVLRNRALDCFETAVIPGQPQEEIDRLLSIVVVGGGPAGVEYCAELNDWLSSDLNSHFPEVAGKTQIHLVEALPKILNMFDARLIDFVETTFQNNPNIKLHTNTMVTKVGDKSITVKDAKTGEIREIPCGMTVWVAGNAPRALTRDLMTQIGAEKGQNDRRGLKVDDKMRVIGADGIWAIGDCAISQYPATAQVASQEGAYLGRLFNRVAKEMHEQNKLGAPASQNAIFDAVKPFRYQHFGQFAYIGDSQAIAQLERSDRITSAGVATFVLWRSVYMSKLLSVRNRVFVALDWIKSHLFGRDISRG